MKPREPNVRIKLTERPKRRALELLLPLLSMFVDLLLELRVWWMHSDLFLSITLPVATCSWFWFQTIMWFLSHFWPFYCTRITIDLHDSFEYRLQFPSVFLFNVYINKETDQVLMSWAKAVKVCLEFTLALRNQYSVLKTIWNPSSFVFCCASVIVCGISIIERSIRVI